MKEIRSAIFVHAGYQQRDTVGSTHLILATVAKFNFFVTNCLDLGKGRRRGNERTFGQTPYIPTTTTRQLLQYSELEEFLKKKTLTTEDTFIGSSYVKK